jgi:hypothetical protein
LHAGGNKRNIESKFKKLLSSIPNSKIITATLFSNSNFFKKKKNKFIKNILKDDEIIIKNLIENYKTTKIKKEKKILMKQLTQIQFKKLKEFGLKETNRKTYNKYKFNLQPKLSKSKKIKQEKDNFIKNFLKENSNPSSNKTVEINNELLNVRYLNTNKTNLFKKIQEELNKKKETNNILFKIGRTYFYNFTKKLKIFKDPKIKLDYCPTCLFFMKKKILNKDEKEMYDNHIQIKDNILEHFKKKKKNLKEKEITIVFDFKENLILNNGNDLINGECYQNNENYFNRKLVLCFSGIIYFNENNLIKKKFDNIYFLFFIF